MKDYISPEEYFDGAYKADLDVFGGKMLCGFTFTDSMLSPKRKRFKGFAEFVVCQFELNLLSQAFGAHKPPGYSAWWDFSAQFADPRQCFSGHGMGNHMPYSILRFAQKPCAARNTPPVVLNWNILREYTEFFFGGYLSRFRSTEAGRDFSRETLLRAMGSDRDCFACVLTSTGWEEKNVVELLEGGRAEAPAGG